MHQLERFPNLSNPSPFGDKAQKNVQNGEAPSKKNFDWMNLLSVTLQADWADRAMW